MGVAPPPESNFTHGRRKFLGKNQNEDRNGVPRLADVSHLDAAAPKKRKAASKSKELPPTKTKGRGKKTPIAVSDSSSESEEAGNDDDDMYVSDVPKTGPKPAVASLEIPFYSTSPRTTRSARAKQLVQKSPDRIGEKQAKKGTTS